MRARGGILPKAPGRNRARPSWYTGVLDKGRAAPVVCPESERPRATAHGDTSSLSGLLETSTGYERNSLVCLRNAGFHFAVTYCIGERERESMCVRERGGGRERERERSEGERKQDRERERERERDPDGLVVVFD